MQTDNTLAQSMLSYASGRQKVCPQSSQLVKSLRNFCLRVFSLQDSGIDLHTLHRLVCAVMHSKWQDLVLAICCQVEILKVAAAHAASAGGFTTRQAMAENLL